MDKQIEVIITSRHKIALDIRELWQYRELFYFFTWRDLKVKYKQAFLGFLWVILQPVMMMIVFTFFFGQALNIPSEGIPYPVFAFSGIILWTTFSASVTNAGNSMISNSNIIQKIYFPRLIIPISSILVALVDLLVSLFVFSIFLLVYPCTVNLIKVFLCWPLAILLMLSGSLGLGCGLSALTIKYRDFRFVIPFLIQIGFFLTPVVYPLSLLKVPWITYILALNPMYGAILLFRAPLSLETPDFLMVGISVVSALILIVIGIGYFKKTELYFADLA